MYCADCSVGSVHNLSPGGGGGEGSRRGWGKSLERAIVLKFLAGPPSPEEED